MNLYNLVVPQLIQTLGQLHRWLDKGKALAEQKKFDVGVLLAARLAPDQYPLSKQIQVVSDTAKSIAGNLAGVTPPVFEDNEKTLDDLRARIDKTIDWLKTLKPEQFEGGDGRTVSLSFLPGKGLKGPDYLFKLGLPNFYFHATTAYAILRHNGVDVGKIDFIGDLPLVDA